MSRSGSLASVAAENDCTNMIGLMGYLWFNETDQEMRDKFILAIGVFGAELERIQTDIAHITEPVERKYLRITFKIHLLNIFAFAVRVCFVFLLVFEFLPGLSWTMDRLSMDKKVF